MIKTCGIFVFNTQKELLVTLPYNSEDWFVPEWKHTGHKDYLDVARTGVIELTGIDYFNYKEEYFKIQKFQRNKNSEFIPFVIFNEEKVDNFKCWITVPKSNRPIIDDWDWVSKKEALGLMNGLQRKALLGIKVT